MTVAQGLCNVLGHGRLAQLAEHRPHMPGVAGSSPASSTIESTSRAAGFPRDHRRYPPLGALGPAAGPSSFRAAPWQALRFACPKKGRPRAWTRSPEPRPRRRGQRREARSSGPPGAGRMCRILPLGVGTCSRRRLPMEGHRELPRPSMLVMQAILSRVRPRPPVSAILVVSRVPSPLGITRSSSGHAGIGTERIDTHGSPRGPCGRASTGHWASPGRCARRWRSAPPSTSEPSKSFGTNSAGGRQTGSTPSPAAARTCPE